MRQKPVEDLELIGVFKALGDAHRFRMVRELAAAGELSCGQVAERFPLAQATISHHLKILADAGLVIVRPEAKHRFFSENRALLTRVVDLLPARLTPARKPKVRTKESS